VTRISWSMSSFARKTFRTTRPRHRDSEKWALQDAHRNQLPKSPYFCGSPESAEDMRVWASRSAEAIPPPQRSTTGGDAVPSGRTFA